MHDRRLPRLEGYRLHTALGKGTTASVFRATHLDSGAEVAIKVVSSDVPRLALAAEQEVRAMARVNHPNLVAVYDYGRFRDGRVWLAVEYASGGSLLGWMPDSWEELRSVLDDVLAGLAHAHPRGLVHRDLKPENLLWALPEDGLPGVKIADFGLTTIRDIDPVLRRGGTPLYMAPEQMEKGVVLTAAADLYALGGMLWHWVTGKPPFTGELPELMRRHREAPLPSFRPRFMVPEGFEDLVRALLAKQPAERPATVGMVRRALSQEAGSVSAAMASVTERATLGVRLAGVGLGVVPLRDHALLGRERPREVLTAALESVLHHRKPQVVLVTGPPGVGASRLARWVGETAEEAGLVRLLWGPGVRQVEKAAHEQPVVACFDDDHGATESLVATLSFLDLPVLVVVTLQMGENWELEGQGNVRRVELAALGRIPMRRLLEEQVGLCPEAAVWLSRKCGNVPGRNLAYLTQLVAGGFLRATSGGFALGPGPLPEPPAPHQLGSWLVRQAVEQASDAERRALRLGAVLGTEMTDVAWGAMLRREGLQAPSSLLDTLQRQGQVLRRDDKWVWCEPTGPASVLKDGGTPDEHLAAATVLGALPETPVRKLRMGLHWLRAGCVAEGRAALLGDWPFVDLELMDLLARSLPEIEAHMDGATTLEHFHLQMLRLRTRMNTTSPAAAVPEARRLVRHIGSPADPGPWWAELHPDDRRNGLELAAITLALSDATDEVEDVLRGLDLQTRGLRALGMAAATAGDVDRALRLYERAYEASTDEPRRARVANGLGSMWAAQGHWEEAGRWFRISAEGLEPGLRFTPLGNLARTFLIRSRFDEAAVAAQEALDCVEAHGAFRWIGPERFLLVLAAAGRGDRDTVARLGDLALFDQRRHGEHLDLVPVLEGIRSYDAVITRFVDTALAQEARLALERA